MKPNNRGNKLPRKTDMDLIKVNLPEALEDFKTGNGEGVWVHVLDPACLSSYNKDYTGGIYVGILANNSVYYPKFNLGSAIVFTLRGERRPVASFMYLNDTIRYLQYLDKYPNICGCEDAETIFSELGEYQLTAIESVIDAFEKGEIDISNPSEDSDFTLTLHDLGYEELGCEITVLRWYNGWEDTDYLLEAMCKKGDFIFTSNVNLEEIVDSMQLESGTVIATLEKDGCKASLEVRGEVQVSWISDPETQTLSEAKTFYSPSEFPQELKQLIAADQLWYEDPRVVLTKNNWFEVFVENPTGSPVPTADYVDAEGLSSNDVCSLLSWCIAEELGLNNPSESEGAESERYEVITIMDDIPALFTNGRVDRDSLPDGLFAYDLRHGDDICFVTIEPRVVVNHSGTIITATPIDFGDKGYIELDDDTSPNFIGDWQTLEEFARKQKV